PGFVDGPAAIRVGVEAVDDSGRRSTLSRTLFVDNVAPEIVSQPPTTYFVGVETRYQVTVRDRAAHLDPPRFELVHAPALASVSDEGVVTFTAPDPQPYEFELRVDDRDGGETMQRWTVHATLNSRPSIPSPRFPVRDLVVADSMPALEVHNAHDLDGDSITY